MLRRRNYESRRGFTLVELVVVLVILAVLASVTVPAFSRQVETGRERKAVTEAQACVTAATGLAAQKYTEARTAYIQDSSKDIKVALASWAGKVQDERPTVTGTLAQREGNGEYLLDPQNAPGGTAAGATDVKAAAGVDGTVQTFWCNANGQIVYLLYKSADDIWVAYANSADAGDNGIVIPTANVPTAAPTPTKTPTPSSTPVPTVTPTPTTTAEVPATPDPGKSEGNMIIHLIDAVTGKGVPSVPVTVVNSDGAPAYSYSPGNTDSGGFAYIPAVEQGDMQANPDAMGRYYSYRLIFTTPVSGYQDLVQTKFSCTDISPAVKVTAHIVANGEKCSENMLNLPIYPVAAITFKSVTSAGNARANVFYEIKGSDGKSITIKTDENGEVSVPVKIHSLDGTGATCLDLSTVSNHLLDFTVTESGKESSSFSIRLNVGDPNAAHDFEFHWPNGGSPSHVTYESATPTAADGSYNLIGYSTHTLTIVG